MTARWSRSRRVVRCGIAAGTSMLLSGCGMGLESLPLAAPSGGTASYVVTAAFTNALNLPAKAKVRLNGADIGEVESIRAHNFAAYVTMRIRSTVTLPVDSTAQLRSATPLGDLFIAVKPGRAGAKPLPAGATIPIESTSGGATVEEVLSSAALLVNGGVIKNITTLLNGAGTAIGGRGADVAALLNNSSALISRLNARSSEVQSALDATSELAKVLSAHQDTLNAALAAAAPATGVVLDNIGRIADLTDAAARITRQLSRFPSLRGTDTRSLIADLNKLSAAFNDISLDPNLSLTPLNRLLPIVLKSTASTSLRGTGEIVQLALGSLPDKNFPGDPMMHGPDGTDWHAMIGSLRYEWNLLLGKIYGPRQ
ncbi:MCE family protein [Mycobacterium sp. SM3041]|uniref:MCE family protein n=1 Tax=Mycobacterium sp. SM3041 TaxID=3114291 RepID=UPI003204F89B